MFQHLPIFDRIFTSFIRHSSALGLSISSWLSMTFIANSPYLAQWVARKTQPELPLPTHYYRVYPYIFLTIQKFYTFRFGKLKTDDNNQNSVMTSWYGKTTAKQLDSLIDRKAKLSELLLYPDFINELKAYNTKLLDYFTNNPTLMGELVDFIAVPPSPADSE